MIRVAFSILLLGATLLNIFLLLFGNSSAFPLGIADFSFCVAITFLFALYRPGWAFLVFLSLLPFETLNMAPAVLPFSIRPYQLFGAAIFVALLSRFLFRRLPFSLVRLRWFDALPILFALGGFFAIFFSPDAATATKQAIIVLSFVAIYFLSRQFFGDARDARRVMAFLVMSALFSALFALWQSLRFTAGLVSFEAMPGRPNAFFPEPDWLGMYFIFSLGIFFALMFFLFEKGFAKMPGEMQNEKCTMQSFGKFFSYFSPEFFVSHFAPPVGGFILVLGLLLTVARSAWVGFAFSALLFFKLLLVGKYSWNPREWRWTLFAKGSALVLSSFLLALFSVWVFRLTTFELANRAGSTVSGLQEITVSCADPVSLPEKIETVSELSSFGCRHILLEEIDAEKNAGKFVSTVFRPDPSIEARRVIREKTFDTLKNNLVFGIGWGSIGNILGTDDRGASLNASNAFLEAWLGGGIMSFGALLVLWILIPILAFRKFFFDTRDEGSDVSAERAVAVFFLVSWIGFTVFNLFNSGILLGFVWVWLGGIGMIAGRGK